MIFFWQGNKHGLRSLGSAVIFYTTMPLPHNWTGNWERIARWSSLIGLILGIFLGLGDLLLQYCQIPELTRSTLIVAIWIGITGGLHLDGAMDTADGLAVGDRDRALEIMKDSATGAFGAMAGIVILLLKTAALSEISAHTWLVLMVAAAWGRWGQLMAIAFYPYLRAQGKGAFHKKNLQLPQDILVGSIPLLFCSGFMLYLEREFWVQCLMMLVGCVAIALATGYYFYYQFKGHTGDTYGAVVEWSEALILCLLTTSF